MPDKKANVLNQFFCVFKMKKNPCDDIVAVADKVVEDYIISKHKLIHRRYRRKGNGYPFFAGAIAIGAVLTIILLCLT